MIILALIGTFSVLPFEHFTAIPIILGILTVVGFLLRQKAAAHLGVFLCLVCGALYIPGFGMLWPAPLILAALIYAAIIKWVPGMKGGGSWARLGAFGKKEITLCFVFFLVAASGLTLWYFLLDPELGDLTSRLPDWPIALVLFAGLAFSMLNALGEEITFRGPILHGLDAALGAGWAAILIQAVSFGFFHIHGFPRGWAGVLLATVYGVMTGIVRRYSKGLLAPWFTHVLADITIVLLVLYEFTNRS